MSVEVVFETHSLSVDNERGIATGWPHYGSILLGGVARSVEGRE